MSEQLAFDMPVDTAFDRTDFFTSDANSAAVDAIENWRQWPQGKLILAGSEGSGKSHLARIWAEMVLAQVIEADGDWDAGELVQGQVCVENVHRIAGNRVQETRMFHVYNLMAQNGFSLLMTGRNTPKNWAISVPDLASRLQATHLVQLGPPDDTLLAAVLLKQCSDRQLQMEPGVVAFVLQRVERSFAGVRRVVEALDRLSLQRKRPVGKRMAAETLHQMETHD